MRVVFLGTPDFAVPPLEYLVFHQYEVVAVYTPPDKVVGRGHLPVSSPVKKIALNQGFTVVQPLSFKKPEVVASLASFRPQIMVVAAFGQILPQSVLELPRYGCLNLHPSLLPKYRGASPVAAAILAGEQFTGVSIMLLDRGLDTGPVLARAPISISAWDTTASLTAKLSRVAAQLLLEVLPNWIRGELTPQPQDESQMSYSHVLTKKDGEIDWQFPALAIWRQVRAFHPWPGCYTRWQGKQLKIIEAVPLSGERTTEVGQVVALSREGVAFGINTGDGVLGILRVQLEGKKVLSAAEFLRGQRQFIGAILPSD